MAERMIYERVVDIYDVMAAVAVTTTNNYDDVACCTHTFRPTVTTHQVWNSTQTYSILLNIHCMYLLNVFNRIFCFCFFFSYSRILLKILFW